MHTRTEGLHGNFLKLEESDVVRYESSIDTSPDKVQAASGILRVFHFHQFHSQKCVFLAYGSFWMLLGSSGMPRGCFMGPRGCSVGPSKNHGFYKVWELWGAIRAKRDLPRETLGGAFWRQNGVPNGTPCDGGHFGRFSSFFMKY